MCIVPQLSHRPALIYSLHLVGELLESDCKATGASKGVLIAFNSVFLSENGTHIFIDKLLVKTLLPFSPLLNGVVDTYELLITVLKVIFEGLLVLGRIYARLVFLYIFDPDRAQIIALLKDPVNGEDILLLLHLLHRKLAGLSGI